MAACVFMGMCRAPLTSRKSNYYSSVSENSSLKLIQHFSVCLELKSCTCMKAATAQTETLAYKI